jgi:hypothetical protein
MGTGHFVLAQALGEYGGVGAVVINAVAGVASEAENYARQIGAPAWLAIAAGGVVLWLFVSRRR